MNGRIAALAILISSIVAGVGLYYTQEYAFYRDVSPGDVSVRLMPLDGDAPEPIAADIIAATDSDSSPIRFRACFTTDASLAALTAAYVGVPTATPRNAPDWFECFDAEAIAEELKAGTALVFMGGKNVDFGVDRVVAVTQDGRGYIWHELNDCGEKAYDGTIVGEECPRREEN